MCLRLSRLFSMASMLAECEVQERSQAPALYPGELTGERDSEVTQACRGPPDVGRQDNVSTSLKDKTNDPSLDWSACDYISNIVVNFSLPHKDTQGRRISWRQVVELRGVAGAWAISLCHISDVQLSKERDMEYLPAIRKTKHSRALPIYSAINLWLGDLRGIYGRDKSRGCVPWGSQAETGATPVRDGAGQ